MEFLIEIAVRLLNSALGAILGWAVLGGMLSGGRFPRPRLFGLDLATRLLIGTVAGAIIGLIWGKATWRYIDKKIDGGWTGRGP
jgi:hypothetical protein